MFVSCNSCYSSTHSCVGGAVKGQQTCVLPVQEISPEWQMAASALLVAIGSKHCNDVMTELLEKLHPGVLPHFFVVQTLASLATANGK